MQQHFGHLDTGILGTRYLFEALVKHGRMDVAMTIALQTTEPSYGYQILNVNEPATTMWELWNGDTQGPGMNSRNHIMFGTVDTWLYKHVAGLALADDAIEFDKLIVKPDAALLIVKSRTCAILPEGKQTLLTCGDKGKIEQILFASFGTPTGSCMDISSLAKGSCHSNTSRQMIESACLNHASCQISAQDTIFGDPCFGVKKKLEVAVKCSSDESQGIPISAASITTQTHHGEISLNWTATATQQGNASRVVSISLSIPPGTVSTAVHVPNVSTFVAGSSLEIEESGKAVWQNNAFVPGVPGIISGKVSVDHQFVVFHVTTGVYQFKSSSK